MKASSVHELLTALYDVLEAGPGSGDIDWLLLCALGTESIVTTDGLTVEEKRLYNAVRNIVVETEWRIP